MANNRMTLKATLELGTKQFKGAVRGVEAALNGLKMKFMGFAAALAGGAGFADFGKTLIDATKKMDQALTTLKNVSGGEFAKNQQFLIDMANRYNQNIITLTGNFSKFTASCNEANMSIKDQKKIFEALTRASTYFNLSNDDTNGVFLAITQMMSKGKVSAEELRRQLGERLPGAFGLMAKAAGMSTEELDGALKAGRLMAKDVLPKFADELNRVTANIDTDTIQGWTNRLQNAIADLSSKMNLEGAYKNVVKFGTKTTEFITRNIKNIQNAIVGLFTAKGLGFLGKKQIELTKYFDDIQEKFKDTKYKEHMSHSYLNHMLYKTNQSVHFGDDGPSYLDMSKIPGVYGFHLKRKRNLDLSGYTKREQARINSLINEGNKAHKQSIVYMEQLGKKTSYLGVLWRNLKTLMASAFPIAVFQAVITGLSMAISKTIQLATAARKVRKEYAKMNEEWARFKKEDSPEMALLKAYQEELAEAGKPVDESIQSKEEQAKRRAILISSINDALKGTGAEVFDIKSSDEEINKALEKRIKLLEEEKNSRRALELYTEAINRGQDLQGQKKSKEDSIEEFTTGIQTGKYEASTAGGYIWKLKQELKAINAAIKENDQVIKERRKHIIPTVEPEEGLNNNEQQQRAALDDLIAHYREEVALLKLKLREKAITEDEYKSALQSLTKTTLDKVYELKGIPDTAKKDYDAFKYELINLINGMRDNKMAKILDEFNQKVKETNNMFENNVITLDEYDDIMNDLIADVKKSIYAFDKIPEGVKKFLDSLDGYPAIIEDKAWGDKMNDQQMAKWDKDKEGTSWFSQYTKKNAEYWQKEPELKGRDSFYDYKKDNSQILEEEIARWDEYADALREYIEEARQDPEIIANIDELEQKLDEAIGKSRDFQEALKLATVKEDIKQFKSELQSGVLDSIQGIAGAIDRLQNAMDKLNDPDISGWEKMVAILNMLIQTTETLLHTMELFESITKIIKMLTGAEAALGTIQDVNAKKNITNAGAEIATEGAKAMASGTASAAKAPWPLTLVALATTVAGIAGILSTIPKYSTGGLIGGHTTTGDKLLARVNSGEMILNKSQQGALLNQLNGTGGQVQFKIKGTDLVGVLNNYNKKITK